MNSEQAKKELVNRYKYLYENAYLVLAPYMHEQSVEEYQRMVDEYKKRYDIDSFKSPLIYLKISIYDSINGMFEEFLLSDLNINDTKLYKFIESKREDKEYLEKVKAGLELVKKDNNRKSDMFKEKLDIWRVLQLTYDYIVEQSGDLKNKENKLKVIDEYCKICRYRNDGKIYTSGRNLNLHDVDSLVIPTSKRAPFRDKMDIGIANNSFIRAICNIQRYKENSSIFTEDEKQEIYLQYHDELPWNLLMVCKLEEEYIKTRIETRLCRPENTEPCLGKFMVDENEIFINPDDRLYRYYQVCPHCGYIVNIPKEILSDGIKKRIEDRCSKDDKLFRKMYLYSELFSLDNKSVYGQKKLLKK